MSTTKVTSYGVDLYKMKINDGGSIEFDVNNGSVVINGNLDIKGTTTSITSVNVDVTDNIITLNKGETGNGVALKKSGISIDRGTAVGTNFWWNEDLSFLDSQTGTITRGAFELVDNNGNLYGLYTNSIKTLNNKNLYLLSEGTGIISVTGTTDYEKQIFPYTGSSITYNGSNPDSLSAYYDADIIPNIKAVTDYVQSYNLYNFQSKITSPTKNGTTSVEVQSLANGDPISQAIIVIDGSTKLSINLTSAEIFSVKLSDNTIENTTQNTDLILTANGTGNIQLQKPLTLIKQTQPAIPADGVSIYGQAEGAGKTGIYFINESGETDELISRSKSLLYSIIF